MCTRFTNNFQHIIPLKCTKLAVNTELNPQCKIFQKYEK